MPEMTFRVRWPDGAEASCYSPSLVMHDYLTAGAEYPLTEFVERSTTALKEAGQRVKARYGFECTSAMQQEREILDAAAGYDGGVVQVVAMEPPLPPVSPLSSVGQGS